MRVFGAGVAVLTVSFVAYLFARTAGPGWLVWALGVSGAVGLVAFLIGFVGLVVGGRRDVP